MKNYENVISKLHLSNVSVFNELIRIAHHFYREIINNEIDSVLADTHSELSLKP